MLKKIGSTFFLAALILFGFSEKINNLRGEAPLYSWAQAYALAGGLGKIVGAGAGLVYSLYFACR